jgi:hypothetical protein
LDIGDDEYWTGEFLDGLDSFSSSNAYMWFLSLLCVCHTRTMAELVRHSNPGRTESERRLW